MVVEQKSKVAFRLALSPAASERALERRAEARYPTHDSVEVRILIMDGPTLAATVLDVSRSGLRLRLRTSLGKGMRVEIIYPKALVIFGEVRYCRRSGDIFHAGIRIEDIIYPEPDQGHHIHDDHLSLYVLGKGLTVPEVIRIKNHLAHCDVCRVRFADTHALLDPRCKALRLSHH